MCARQRCVLPRLPTFFNTIFAVSRFAVAIPSRVLRIDQQIQTIVAIPIDHRQLHSAGSTARASVQTKWLVGFVNKDSLGRPTTAPQRQVALLIQHHQIQLGVPIKVNCQRSRSPLRQRVALRCLPPVPARRKFSLPTIKADVRVECRNRSAATQRGPKSSCR